MISRHFQLSMYYPELWIHLKYSKSLFSVCTHCSNNHIFCITSLLCTFFIQYFSGVSVLHYLQAVLFIKICTFCNCMNILVQKSLKLRGTNYHFKWGKVPDTAPYWKCEKEVWKIDLTDPNFFHFMI